jgi:phosphoketolase
MSGPLTPEMLEAWMRSHMPQELFDEKGDLIRDKLLDHKSYIYKHWEDMTEIRDWKRHVLR